MKSLFELSLMADPFGRRLGQDDQTVDTGVEPGPGTGIDWDEALSDLIKTGKEIYKGYTASQLQDEAAKKAAAAAAARAAQQGGMTSTPGTLLGIPTTYLIYGGIGLVGLALVFGLIKK